ncbi:DUF5957 family protein [Spongiactinospora sp. TRM90649]|uniref:DUF5957 family protein n=1 Tax=Spongiactinospora sp. TRM90649 TaxID=3031114 RepID=UPI0023F98F1C|nr:DUF5957 family protein [Spongiactinospora sp. TRM90649]MDF5752205.1 DUF5957 family protein [Spongiactinospora sp. TRM90649]
MRTFGVVLAGFIGGFILGIVVSEVVAVVTLALSGDAGGIRYLPLFTAVAGGAVTFVVRRARARRHERAGG